MKADLHVVTIPQLDPRLGRQVVHYPANARYAVAPARGAVLPQTSWSHRLYNPDPLLGQRYGYCTVVDQANRLNARGNRKKGRVLTRAWCEKWYPRTTQLDPFAGEYPPTDTGSSGWAAAMAAREAGEVDRFEWLFGDQYQTLETLRQRPIGFGTWWTANMFDVDPQTGLIGRGGARVGGHQWTAVGYNHRLKAIKALCWWENWGIRGRGFFYIALDHAHELVMDDGDRHITYTT